MNVPLIFVIAMTDELNEFKHALAMDKAKLTHACLVCCLCLHIKLK